MEKKSPYVWIVFLGAASTLAWYTLRDPIAHRVTPMQANAAAQTTPTAATPALVLPIKLERPSIDAASRDPFVPFENSVSVKPASIAITPAPVQAIVAPVAPPLDVRFVGRTVDVHGNTVVFVESGQTSMPLTVGQVLPNGYRVVSISYKVIGFEYPPMSITVQLPLPTQPPNEIR